MIVSVLAQVLGISFVVLGLSIFFHKKNTVAVVEELVQSKSFMWLGGVIALLIGAVMISLNNVWSSGLPLLVTIIGWLALFKGIFILFLPSLSVSFYRKINRKSTYILAGIVLFILGLVLL